MLSLQFYPRRQDQSGLPRLGSPAMVGGSFHSLIAIPRSTDHPSSPSSVIAQQVTTLWIPIASHVPPAIVQSLAAYLVSFFIARFLGPALLSVPSNVPWMFSVDYSFWGTVAIVKTALDSDSGSNCESRGAFIFFLAPSWPAVLRFQSNIDNGLLRYYKPKLPWTMAWTHDCFLNWRLICSYTHFIYLNS